ncbi:MAG: hypothetical protein H7Z14_08615 [Anaerolineae bacterium]|nr:hypothetical protein [Phycisphaerae bacterium]
MIYCLIAMTAVTGFISMGVDVGRVQLAKTELQCAADGIARYAATGVLNGTADNKAKAVDTDYLVDGVQLKLKNGDIDVGVWDSATKTFTVTNTNPNAVRIIARRLQSRDTGVPTIFMRLMGQNYVDIQATAIATYVTGTTTTLTAPSKGNPWLAGMPNGTVGNTFDSAPNNSPSQVTGITMTPGATLNFGFTGSASYYPGTQPFDPDGNPGWIINNYAGREHGKSQLYAPLTAVVGVFLNDTQPNLAGAPPADLDFTSPASRDFATLTPALRQPFFIGNGMRADGTTLQNFVVPAGATRLYLGIMDGQQWSDNSGALTSTVVKPTQITTVK